MLKYSWICIFCLCLLQFAHAVPLQKRTAKHKKTAVAKSDDISFSAKELKSRKQLETTVLADIKSLATYSTLQGRAVLLNTVKELNALPEKSKALKANITRMSNFVKETKPFVKPHAMPGLDKILKEMIKLSDIMEDYENMPDDEELTKTLKTAFEKSGLDEFNSEVEKRTIDFTLSFEKSFDAYLSVASDKHKNSKLLAWFDKLKAEKDGEKKLEIFVQFFEVFD